MKPLPVAAGIILLSLVPLAAPAQAPANANANEHDDRVLPPARNSNDNAIPAPFD